MRGLAIAILLAPVLFSGCARQPEKSTAGTLAELRDARPDVQEASVEHGLDQAMQNYRRFLEETPETAMTPEAMRRLADLQIEQQFGLQAGDGEPQGMAAPEAPRSPATARTLVSDPAGPVAEAGPRESDREFEQRTTAESGILGTGDAGALPMDAMPVDEDPSGPLEAIALYDRLLTEYPGYENSDQVLYQKARAYDELGRTEEAMESMERLIRSNPHSGHYDEVQFRRGEFFFTRRQYRDAESAYSSIISLGDSSSYYELALYKLGWTFYKQELYEEALHRYMALLDHKVSIGYDFDQDHAEEDERRVSDTFRAISLSFSYLGGSEFVAEYYSSFGNRSYENRVYSNLGEHFLAKLRFQDAAKTYKTFVALYPYHRQAPHFSMRVVETFTRGEFPILVLESKREFASRYGLQADYWRHFTPEEAPEVLAYLKSNLKDLATHYHAEYQATEDEEAKRTSFREAFRWYGDYLESFPTDADSPPINYQLADLLLENQEFGEAARQYERTAYEYEPHPQSAAAGYAAVYAYRELLKVAGDERQESVMRDTVAGDERQESVMRDTVASSVRFADAFPEHEHAATVLGAAADDMYEMQDYRAAVEAGRRVIDSYPGAEPAIRRSAWIVVAHGSFDLAEYPQAEDAYSRVLALTPEDEESYAGFVDNLAASIYKQAEIANEVEDYRAAADHFLRIRWAAPTSSIRPAAEYDAGAALIRLEAWTEAASVFEAFRSTYPEHEMRLEATRQIALAYREDDQLTRSADEYNRLASESEDPALRAEALLVAGDLYEQSDAPDDALEVYRRYVDEYPEPVESALEIRFKIAEIHKAADAEALYHQELAEIVRIDAEAGAERTGRTRTLAARSALVLAELLYQEFAVVELVQPFAVSLKDKKQRMDVAVEAMERLVDYEIAEVTAAATYYMAQTYFDFSHALLESERPTDLQPAELDEYELVLEEEAFPFEEKAIDLHEKNLEMLQAGVFNDWTEKSLDKLAGLMPGRYAKNELSGGFLGAIEVYVYRLPESQASEPSTDNTDTTLAGEPVETTHLVPTVMDDGMVGYANAQ